MTEQDMVDHFYVRERYTGVLLIYLYFYITSNFSIFVALDNQTFIIPNFSFTNPLIC